MLRSRIIPCLLVSNKGLVKTVRFDSPKYVGDPINAVKIFNEKEVDELIVLDIDATSHQQEPDYTMISNLAVECRMPLCYGGGLKNLQQVRRIVGLGVEKVALSSSSIATPDLISEIAEVIGTQSVVVVIDVRREASGDYYVWTHNGTRRTNIRPPEFAREVERLGAGEVVINSIDNDGVMKGYDLDIVRTVRTATTLPVTVLGGAGTLKDIADLIAEFKIIGAAAGSLFVFKGVYRAVLINYPSHFEKEVLNGYQPALSTP
jgi:cyclase